MLDVFNPTSSYFLSTQESNGFQLASSWNSPPEKFDGGSIIIVRYLTREWKRFISKVRFKAESVIYFMDDDLFDPSALKYLPSDYARKIRKLALSHRGWLEENCSEFWVSTLALAAKYKELEPKVVALRPPKYLLERRTSVRVIYHGTNSHIREIEWLRGVIERLQETCLHTTFEIFGDHTVNRMYRDLPRVSVLHPMSWNSYLAYTSSLRADIGLAPLMPSTFNEGRGPVKFYDFARMGAVGVYSDATPYRSFVRQRVDGFLLPNEPELWVDTIVSLVGDPIHRTRLADAAYTRALAESSG